MAKFKRRPLIVEAKPKVNTIINEIIWELNFLYVEKNEDVISIAGVGNNLLASVSNEFFKNNYVPADTEALKLWEEAYFK